MFFCVTNRRYDFGCDNIVNIIVAQIYSTKCIKLTSIAADALRRWVTDTSMTICLQHKPLLGLY